MKRKLIIDGNAVYEIDEDCMLQKYVNKEEVVEKDIQRERQREEQKQERNREQIRRNGYQ